MRVLAGFLVVVVAAASLACLAPGVEAQDPFPQRGRASTPPSTYGPIATTPSVESPPALPCVQAPSLPVSIPEHMQGNGLSPQQGTALEPRPGTGSKLLTGLLAGGKVEVTHQVDPAALAGIAQLSEAMKKLQSPKGEVSISPSLPPETSASLSQLSSRLNLLTLLASTVLSIFGAGKLGQWVAPLVAGLRSAIAARFHAPSTSPEVDQLSRLLNQLLADKAAAPASTPPPAS